MSEGPRIYNIFPLLLGPVSRWTPHLERAAAMGFNWVYVNPFHLPGFSGSLYAVKDYYRLHPAFREREEDDSIGAVRPFIERAAELGVKVMVDLVINHTSKDSLLVGEHPEWFKRDEQGRIKSPSAIDPADARKVTVWGDLAEVEHLHTPDREGQWRYWRALVESLIDLGVAGFRCDAAYQVPADLWSYLIDAARRRLPGCVFCAETLGCREEEVERLAPCGFDFLFNSSKWWDFHADWCLEQYERFGRIAPSISFAETHDTGRLAAEAEGDVEIVKQRLFFAALFSTGVMMPMGCEYGFRKKPHVVRTTPDDWEPPAFDLSDYVARINGLKARLPVLNGEGAITRLSPAGEPVAILLKTAVNGADKALLLINSDGRGPQEARLAPLPKLLGHPPCAIQDVSLEGARPITDAPYAATLPPSAIMVIHAGGAAA